MERQISTLAHAMVAASLALTALVDVADAFAPALHTKVLHGKLFMAENKLTMIDDADEIESVFDQISLDFEVQGGLECE